MRDSLHENFLHIRSLAKEIDKYVIHANGVYAHLETNIAGMLAVSIVATYEDIVRSTLIEYAERNHPKFHTYVSIDFERMNSKINLSDLHHYSRKFGLSPWESEGSQKDLTTFQKLLHFRKPDIERRLNRDLYMSYNNLFKWRIAYAHRRFSMATLKEVYTTHHVAKHVIKAFVDAFEQG